MPQCALHAVIAHADQLALGKSDVLCHTPRGTLLRRDYYNREIWKPAVAAAGLPADTTFHDYADACLMPTSGRSACSAVGSGLMMSA